MDIEKEVDEEIKEKLEAIWPQAIGAVITKTDAGANLCPVTFQAVSSIYEQPLSVCLGLDNRNLTIESVLETGELVYAYPAKAQLKDILYCGTVSGRDGDKLAKTNLKFQPAEKVTPPLLVDAVLNYECKVVHHYNAGQFTIVVAEVVNMVGSDKYNLEKIYGLGGQNYGVVQGLNVLQVGRT